jgi:hypothetical protein
LAGCVLLGFAAARFLRAVAEPRPRSRVAAAPSSGPGMGGPV